MVARDGPASGALPYRPCVGVMLIGPAGHVFAGQRRDTPGAWQMPQGGIDGGETPRQAALRELEEETGVPARLAEVLRESAGWIAYDLPPHLIGTLWKGRYRGQTQKWLALRFLGADADVDILRDGAHAEFARWAWMTPAALVEAIVPFKRATYAQVFAEFADLLAPGAPALTTPGRDPGSAR